ncbi:hypothetical protein ACJMK2_020698 [Sinanodonta woodiana]|uniref:THAP-type domain-containing protein n=1 Tax=Sinanodonta woodiana TaxID=1069815 RepID=A0ABD3U2P0_SINWO
MPICDIVGCSNRKGCKTLKLSEQRRRLWKAAINRKDIVTEERWERTLACAKHFVGGVKAYLHDRTSPSWLPTLDLGYTEITSSVIGAAHERFNRSSQWKHKRKISDAVSSLLTLKKRCIDLRGNNASDISEYVDNTEIQNESTFNVRIHVERFIGLVLQKFRICEGIIPIEFIKLKQGESVSTIDKIVKVFLLFNTFVSISCSI